MPYEWTAGLRLGDIMGHKTPKTVKELAALGGTRAGRTFWQLYLAWALVEQGADVSDRELATNLTYVGDASMYAAEFATVPLPKFNKNKSADWNYQNALIPWFNSVKVADDTKGDLSSWREAVRGLKAEIHSLQEQRSLSALDAGNWYSWTMLKADFTKQFRDAEKKDPTLVQPAAQMFVDIYNRQMLPTFQTLQLALEPITKNSEIGKRYKNTAKALNGLKTVHGEVQKMNLTEVYASIKAYNKAKGPDEVAEAVAKLYTLIMDELRGTEIVLGVFVGDARRATFKQSKENFAQAHVEVAQGLAVAKGVLAVTASAVSCAPPPGPVIGLGISATMFAVDQGIKLGLAISDSKDYRTVLANASSVYVSKKDVQRFEKLVDDLGPQEDVLNRLGSSSKKVALDMMDKLTNGGVTPDKIKGIFQSPEFKELFTEYSDNVEELKKKIQELVEEARGDTEREERLEMFFAAIEVLHMMGHYAHIVLESLPKEVLEGLKGVTEASLHAAGYGIAGVGAVVGVGLAIKDFRAAGTKQLQAVLDDKAEARFQETLNKAFQEKNYAGRWEEEYEFVGTDDKGHWQVVMYSKTGAPVPGRMNEVGHFQPDSEQGYLESLQDHAEANVVANNNTGTALYNFSNPAGDAKNLRGLYIDWRFANFAEGDDIGFKITKNLLVQLEYEKTGDQKQDGVYVLVSPAYLTYEGELKRAPKAGETKPAKLDLAKVGSRADLHMYGIDWQHPGDD